MRTSARAGAVATAIKRIANERRRTETSWDETWFLAAFVTRKTAEMQHASLGLNDGHVHGAEVGDLGEGLA